MATTISAVPYDPQYSVERAARTLPPTSTDVSTRRSISELSQIARKRLAAISLVGENKGQPSTNLDFARGGEFVKLHRKIRRLQLGTSTAPAKKKYPTPGTSGDATSDIYLWNFMQSKYENMIIQLIDDSIEDSFRRAACQSYDQMFEDWTSECTLFEKEICEALGYSDSKPLGEVGIDSPRVKPHQQDESDSGAVLTPEERVLLVCLSTNLRDIEGLNSLPVVIAQPYTGTPLHELYEDIKRWSLSVVPPAYREDCSQLWNIFQAIAGVKDKHGGGVESFRSLILNSLQLLERFCLEQIEAVSAEMAAQSGRTVFRSSGGTFAGIPQTLMEFCNPDGVANFPSNMGHLWQLAYWSLRSGCAEALDMMASCVRDGHVNFPVDSYFGNVCNLLAYRLLQTSHSLQGRSDNPYLHVAVNIKGHGFAPRVEMSDFDHHQRIKDLRASRPSDFTDSTAALLVSIVDPPEMRSVGLRKLMPNATTEDFIWFNLHGILTKAEKASGVLLSELMSLQSKVLSAGPDHFSAGDQPATQGHIRDINYAKVLLYVVRISDALAWLINKVPPLKDFCLHLTFFLNKLGIIGGAQLGPSEREYTGLLPLTFERPYGLDSLCLGVVCAELLRGRPLRVKLPYLQMLAMHDKVDFLDSIVDEDLSALPADDALGEVDLSDGHIVFGPMYHALLPVGGGEGDDPDRLEIFEGLCITVGQHCEETGSICEAVKCYLIGGRHAEALNAIATAFNNPAYFPNYGALADDTATVHSTILRYFSIYESNKDELQLPFELWETTLRLHQIVTAYTLTRVNEIQAALDHMDACSLIPTRQGLKSWCKGPFAAHTPRLIDCYVFCLYDAQSRKVFRGEPTELWEKVYDLSSICETLNDRGFNDSVGTASRSLTVPAAAQRKLIKMQQLLRQRLV